MTKTPIRYGIIGAGMMGREHIENVKALDGAVVTALADPHPLSQQAAREVSPHPPPAVFDSHHQLIESELCDAVVVATPNNTHFPVLMDLIETDLHILTEKPLCTTVEDCQQLVQVAAGRQALVWVGMEYRYMPSVARLIAEVDEGSAGHLTMLTIREHRFPFLDKVNDWNRFNANTGGTLVEKCCHHFDLMNRILGQRPRRVFASGSQAVNHLDEVYEGRRSDLLDNAYVILEYEGGMRAMLELCMFAEGGRTQMEITVVGDRAKLEAHTPSGELAVGPRDGPWFSPRVEVASDPRVAYEGHHHGASYLEHLDFRNTIRGDSHRPVNLEDGLWAVAIGVAAHKSIEQERPVELAEVLGKAV